MPCPQGINIPACFTAYNQSFVVGRMTGIIQYLTGVGAASGSLHLASDCVNCGACVKKCPQHIPVPDELKNVSRRLQPAGMGKALHAYNALTTRRR